jgi:hypothetical protein
MPARSVKYWEKYIDRISALGQKTLYGSLGIGLSYWMHGDTVKADCYFDQHIIFCMELIDSDKSLHSFLSKIYAIKGERERAYEHLRKFNELEGMPIHARGMKDDLFYKNIRNEPEFLQIASEIETKYQAEHERVRRWLEENEML